ncbi:MAG TPA: DUF1707 domain-containing protein [Dehalococcoidia bacterium]|nr:DUF1707 domain-containing protein [Dehalococcoidia bacterium]
MRCQRRESWELHQPDDGWSDEGSDGPDGTLLVSDGEREAAMDELRRHTAAGRLTVDEFRSRLDEALAARTRSNLRASLRGLPRAAARAHAVRPRPALPLLLMLALVLLIVTHGWALLPLLWAGYFIFGLGSRRYHRRRATML